MSEERDGLIPIYQSIRSLNPIEPSVGELHRGCLMTINNKGNVVPANCSDRIIGVLADNFNGCSLKNDMRKWWHKVICGDLVSENDNFILPARYNENKYVGIYYTPLEAYLNYELNFDQRSHSFDDIKIGNMLYSGRLGKYTIMPFSSIAGIVIDKIPDGIFLGSSGNFLKVKFTF